MNIYIVLHFFLILKLGTCKKLDFQDLVFIVLSQENPVHEEKAFALESDIMKQTNNSSIIYVTHRDLNHVGDWTIIPLLERLWNILKGEFEWMIFCTDQTKFNVTNLVTVFHKYNKKSSIFIGNALQDSEPTIIHHFASIPQFKYPLFASGFAFNHVLLQRLMSSVDGKVLRKTELSIDASHELALFLKKNLNGTLLVNSHHFCLDYEKDCATHVSKKFLCGELSIQKLFFAVKTCKKFHQSRVPVVKTTWAKRLHNVAFFSEAYDENIPTIKLNVSNTESGHCTKTEALLEVMKQYLIVSKDLEWVFLSDDDTILSVRRVQNLLACYDSDKPYILGERYGYNVYSETGYNYITGGGGAALSRAAVMKLAEGKCKCPSESTPDDMYLLGVCAKRLDITLVHVPLFHQARPNDYSANYLKIGDPISFHKHWMTDPVQIYEEWFSVADTVQKEERHVEL